MSQCTATSKRTGQQCQQPAMHGSTKCYHHGGATPRGAKSPHFKTGLYSKYASHEVGDKIEEYLAADPFDLTHELALTRALLADYLSRFQEHMPMGLDSIDGMTVLVDRIRKTVETIVKIRNDSALTAAEVTFLASRIVGLLDKYIDDPAKREACQQELFSFIPAANPGLTEATPDFE